MDTFIEKNTLSEDHGMIVVNKIETLLTMKWISVANDSVISNEKEISAFIILKMDNNILFCYWVLGL